MKTIIIILTIIFLASIECYSQLRSDYPFKTYLDANNRLYVVGNGFNVSTNSVDLVVEKYNGTQNVYTTYFPNFAGLDRGLDLIVDGFGNVVVTGYIYNSETASNDIVLLKYNSLGVYQWHEILPNGGDDKALGIDANLINGEFDKIFVSGYLSNPITGKDFFTAKYSSDGDLIWQETYDQDQVDNVATDIHLDGYHAYVSGYTRERDYSTNDFMVSTYMSDGGSLSDAVTYNKPGSNELPAEFIITNRSMVAVQKSRSSVICVTDDIPNSERSSNYLSIFFDEDQQNNLKVRWSQMFSNGPESRVNVPTSILDLIGFIS